ncbi:predicted protein, partial [Thalassiosira pseudonana CCMP1335]
MSFASSLLASVVASYLLVQAVVSVSTIGAFSFTPHRQHVVAVRPPSSITHRTAFTTTTANMSSSSNNNSNNNIDLPSSETLDLLLSTAIAASQKAGEIILGNAGGAEVLKSKANSRDLLTLIDPLCEKTIRETVLATFPNHDFLGEEDTPPGKEASALAIDAKLSNNPSNYLWIVDPIDGTSNFVHGMPLCMPSIAVAYKGEVV